MAKGKTYQKKKDVRVDFTPMVDMNMLLITFFMLCTTMIKSQTLQIMLPSNEKLDNVEQQQQAKESEAITIIVDSDQDKDGVPTANYVYFYEGKPALSPDGNTSNLIETEFKGNVKGVAQGIRAILQKKNEQVVEKIKVLKEQVRNKAITEEQYQEKAKEIRNDSTLTRPVVIIKATPWASYKSIVTALDEMQINNISRYQLDPLDEVSIQMLTPFWKERKVDADRLQSEELKAVLSKGNAAKQETTTVQ